jgi:predicted  nucleic acid-binding Zn-ribbon protein
MIDIGLYVALGFLLASLLALMVAPAFWRRAVRLTKRRVEMTMPMSASDIQADKDQLRAEFAIELRRVEVGLEKAKDKAARELVEANKRRVEISEIKTELEGTRGRLQEKDNANRVLEQTIRRRLPELEGRLKAAKEAMAELEAANNELRNTAGSQAEALKLARSTLNTQRGDIDQLRGALEGDAAPSRRSSKSDAQLAKENRRLSAELSKLKQELTDGRIGGNENGLLREELGKLASHVLAVAKSQGTALPDFAPFTSRPAPQQMPREREIEQEPAFLGRNGGDRPTDASPPPEPLGAGRLQDSLTALSGKAEEAVPDDADAEDEPEATGALAKLLSLRKARRRGNRGRRTGSLSERLKNLSADSPDS